MKLCLENNQNIPSILILEDEAEIPEGYSLRNNIDDWHNYSRMYIGTMSGFMDWKILRDKIKSIVQEKAGNDLLNYNNNLTLEERKIASIYIPTTIIDALGLIQIVIDLQDVNVVKQVIKDYMILSSQARKQRFIELSFYFYSRIGKNHSLEIEKQLRSTQVGEQYVERGVLKKSVDGVDGLEDYFRSEGSFVNAGILSKLNDNTYTLINDGSGQTNQQFIDKCIDIVDKGEY